MDPDCIRCTWPGLSDPDYVRYHDTEWGVPHADERKLFEKLLLEGFQSGLSWLTILRKRNNFRAAFDGFDPERIARYGEADVARLMADAGIVRNRLKVEGAIVSAQAYLTLRETTTLGDLLWDIAIAEGPLRNYARHGDVPAQTAASVAMSKELKKRGFKFTGPTTLYAFMQSVGMVNDHLTSCFCHERCAVLQAEFRARRAGRDVTGEAAGKPVAKPRSKRGAA